MHEQHSSKERKREFRKFIRLTEVHAKPQRCGCGNLPQPTHPTHGEYSIEKKTATERERTRYFEIYDRNDFCQLYCLNNGISTVHKEKCDFTSDRKTSKNICGHCGNVSGSASAQSRRLYLWRIKPHSGTLTGTHAKLL